MYASESFYVEMCERENKLSRPAMRQLELDVERMMPGYNATIGKRFPIKDFLKDLGGNADVVFLSAAWYYSCIVPEEKYTWGLRV